MGQLQHTGKGHAPARGRRLGWRICLRKGCGRRFQARRYNQRYCREPECLREVHCWQAAKRQRKRRADPDGRREHAAAERQRRQRKAAQAPEREGLATEDAADARAWSRSKRLPENFCDRPGCYESPRVSPRVAASYCSNGCRAAVEQVHDRERKWLRRKGKAGRFKRRLEYAALKARRRREHTGANCPAAKRSSAQGDSLPRAVPGYRCAAGSGLSCEGSVEVKSHDSQASSASRPRAPPAP